MAALAVLIYLTLLGVSSSETTDCSYYGLLKHLNLTGSSNIYSMMRPVKNWTNATSVQLDIVLFGILDVDAKSQTVTNHLWITMYWTNELLTWNAADFCGIHHLYLPRSKLWVPDVIIQEDASDSGSIQTGPFLTLYSDGRMISTARQRLTYTCKLNLVKFPFDTQTCNITFSPMNSDAHSVQLGTLTSDTILTEISEKVMITKGEWSLNSLEFIQLKSNKSRDSLSNLIYMITIERKPMLYLVNFIIPLCYLLMLDLASFFISQSSGEKLNFKVTILLSISVLLLILQDMLPSTEDSLPWIATYCVSIFALVGISVLEAMLVSFLTELSDCCRKEAQKSENAQEDIQLEADFHKASAVKAIAPVSRSELPGVEEKGQVTPQRSFMSSDWPGVRDLLKLILDEVKATRLQAGGTDEDKAKLRCCRSVAEVVDFVFFVLYFFTIVTFLTIVYMNWIHGKI